MQFNSGGLGWGQSVVQLGPSFRQPFRGGI